MTIDAESIAHWQSWIGRTETREERLDPEALRRFAAAIGESLEAETILPSLGHWGFFLPVAAASEIGPDGHPKRGGFLPPITLPRRMFAAADMHFPAPLLIGEPATRLSTVCDVTHKTGRSGELVLVHVEHSIIQNSVERVSELQTIVYRDAGEPTPAVTPAEIPRGSKDVLWQPGPVDLFRFSAVTFNSHRIHYDLPYATGEEGYPGLVVHGPFTAAKLFGHARRQGRPVGFSFRAMAPIFAGQPILLTGENNEVRALRCDGATAMAATVIYSEETPHGR